MDDPMTISMQTHLRDFLATTALAVLFTAATAALPTPGILEPLSERPSPWPTAAAIPAPAAGMTAVAVGMTAVAAATEGMTTTGEATAALAAGAATAAMAAAGRGQDSGGGGRHIDRSTGARIEVDGANIEVIYPDGWKEELQNGWFELKDPAGRTVVERRATREGCSAAAGIAD